jgi:hypothetical protein
VGFIGWRDIKSILALWGKGVQLQQHNFIWHQSCARSKSGLAFLLTFFHIKLFKNHTCYSIEKIMKDSENPSAETGILKKL